MNEASIHNEQKDFFISYHKTDRDWAEWVDWQLEEGGYTVTIHDWDFRPGSNAILNIQKASQTSKRIILILSPNYIETDVVLSEWSSFYQIDPSGEQRIILPVRVRECKPAGILGPLVSIDLVGLREWEARRKLLEGITEGRNKPRKPPNFPIKHTITQDRPIFPASHQKSPQRQLVLTSPDKQFQIDPRFSLLTKGQYQISRQKLGKIFLTIGITLLFICFIIWWTTSEEDTYNTLKYGNPRTYQVDAVVGHNGDSTQHPSHFIAINYHHFIVIHEYEAGDPTKSAEYVEPDPPDDNIDSAPVTLEFEDLDHDKKLDMIITVHLSNDRKYIINYMNTGRGFKADETGGYFILTS